ncbi:ORCT-like protein [Mya arenaria]|uniref:ORCT-like protein n=1 Tax=Mya arenaria TaxID=6604 RepID=A0ABY7EFP3_MYAAR|nr:ORCT-like protein [Mya arenaria]
MSLDDILRDIGEFGPLQKRIYFLLCLPGFILSQLLVVQVFLLATPEHRCIIPGNDNDTFANQSEWHRNLIDRWIPASSDDKHPYDRCNIYEDGNHDGNGTTVKCTEWVYDESVYLNTFTKQLNLVCGEAIKVPNVQMIFFFGVLSGSFAYGQLSDIIGRRKAFYLALVVQLGTSLGLLGMTEYIGFAVLMFFLGGACLGVYMTGFVIGMELVGPNKRLWTGAISPFFLTIGQLYLVLVVYLLRDWKWFMLAVCLPGCFFLLVPESIRWLLSKGKKGEAIEILQKVAKSNKTVLNEKMVDDLPPIPKEARVWKLFSNRTLGIWSVILFVCSMSYYGVVLNTANLGGDIYLNFALLALAEFPGKALILTADRIGRKRLFMAFMFIGGLANIATIGPIVNGSDDLHYVLIALAIVGKLCITGAFDTVYILSAEIFPTVVRNAGMGTSSAIARVGSMIAPYIAKSADLVKGDLGKTIPLTLFGVAMFASGLLTLILPETNGQKMPESIEDIHNLKQI